MGKVVRLTERDLNKLIKRVMDEGVVIGDKVSVSTAKEIPSTVTQGTWKVANGELNLYDPDGKAIIQYTQG
jgi:hypothetical protein